MENIFEWDPLKNESNFAKHGIDFSFAAYAFDGHLLEMADERRNYGETRIIAIGCIGNICLTIVYTKRQNTIRLISARKAHAKEKKAYKEIFQEHAPSYEN